MNEQLLKDYVATVQSGNHADYDSVNAKFPEFNDVDPQVLKDYVATVSSGKHGSWSEVNSKFPEFSSVGAYGALDIVKAKTDKGAETTDHYSMMGFTKAYNEAKKNCS